MGRTLEGRRESRKLGLGKVDGETKSRQSRRVWGPRPLPCASQPGLAGEGSREGRAPRGDKQVPMSPRAAHHPALIALRPLPAGISFVCGSSPDPHPSLGLILDAPRDLQ